MPVQLILSGTDQSLLVCTGQPLDIGFTPAGTTAVMSGFQVDDLYRLACAKILRPPAARVLTPAALQVIGDTGVQGPVAAANHVHLPVHAVATSSTPQERQW